MTKDEIKEEQIKEETPKGDWKQVVSEIFKFENVGDEIIGKLIKTEPSQQFDNNVYTLDVEGKNYVVFGTTILDSRLAMVPLNAEVKIVFSGTKPAEKKGHNDMKQFEVYTK